MDIKITPVNINLLSQQEDYLLKKLKGLAKFSKSFGEKNDLFVTVGKIFPQQETGEIFFAEAKFSIPGKDIVCKVKGSSIKEIANRLKLNLRRLMVENRKTKQSRFRRLARLLKEKFNFRV
ncbi:MAG: hypothetical protein PHN95_01105 [Candidatus Pacebacteria bacterium]|nr:hypothetical protein [Candidatus Paceibacterota bacterium]